MADQEDYKSVWLSKISDFLDKSSNAHDYRRFINKDSEFISSLEVAIKRTLAKQGASDEEKDKFIATLNDDSGYKDCLTGYKGILRRHKQLLDIETQVRKADLESKTRFLIFRILTAIGIALVILATGIVAHELQIPLPLLRIGA